MEGKSSLGGSASDNVIDSERGAQPAPLRIEAIWTGPAVLGECPLWDDRLRRLYWIDSCQRRIWRSDAGGGDLRSWQVPDTIGSIGLCGDHRLIAGLSGGFAFIELDDPEPDIQWIGNPEPDSPGTRLNDGKVDRQGRFWCGSMNRGFSTPNASLYRLDPDLRWRPMDGGFTVSNGIAFSPDGTALYFSDSRVDRSYRYDLDPETGEISNRRPFVDTEAYPGRIDGATVDEDGNYWGALFEGGAVACFSLDGELKRSIRLPVACPTMCAFGGADLDILFVTSATFAMSEAQIAAEPQAGALFAVEGLGVRGVAEPRFASP